MTSFMAGRPDLIHSNVIDRPHVFIDGSWVESDGGLSVEVRNPADQSLVGRAVLGTPADIDRAVAAARRSFDARVWQDVDPVDRRALLLRAADLLEERAERLVDLITRELGCPRWFSEKAHVPSPIRHLRYYADMIGQRSFVEERTDGVNRSYVVQEPVGVVGAITPWNGPLSGPMLKIAPALAAGCSVVAKPSPETPLILHELAEVFAEVGLPEGVFNVVPGGRAEGERLVAHPEVDKVAFTGSSGAGKHIMQVCGSRIARVTLELGGKSAAIILPDADVASAVKKLVPMAMLVNGQACIAQSRVLVHDSIHAEMVEALAAELGSLKVGDPMSDDTDLGPMVSRQHRERVEGYIAKGRSEGARVAVGGGRPAGLEDGWFVEPTLFDGVDNAMTIAREEIFGPVMAAIAYRDVDDAIAIANDSSFGLSGSVWGNEDDGMRVARQVRTGMVSLNGAPQAYGTPFGGFKESGLGREFGPEGLDNYLEPKSIAVAL